MTAPRARHPTLARAAGPLPRPVAYVLGSGASHGAVQVGQLRALHEAGVRPDLIVGCSVGALNGAALAADPHHAVARLTDVWRSLRCREVFPFAFDPPRRRRTLFSQAGVVRVIDRLLMPGTAFADLAVPLYVVATDAATRRPRMFSTGAVAPVLAASSAIPGVFPAVTIDDDRLLDGGIRCSLPVAEAFALGAASVVALPTTHWPDPRVRRWHDPAPPEAATLLLGGTVAPGAGLFGLTFAHTEELIARGYRAARRPLARLMAGEAVPSSGGLAGRTVRTCRRCVQVMT